MGERIRMAVVGGNFGEIHILGYQLCPEIEVKAICRRDEDLARKLAQKHGIGRYYTDFDDLIRSDDIDAVSLAVPHHLHHPMTLKALDHGKHVVCEKPLALNVEQAWEMKRKADETGLIHMIVFNWRFVPAILRMKELVDQGEVGAIHSVLLTWLTGGRENKESPFYWRFAKDEAGVGTLGDAGIHGIDLIRWMVDDFERVVALMAVHTPEHRTEAGGYRKTEVEDSCSFLGELTNGAKVVFHASSVETCNAFMRIELHGSKGVLGVQMHPKGEDDCGSLLSDDGGGALRRKIPIPNRLTTDIVVNEGEVTPRACFFARFAKRFVKAIETGRSLSPNFYDGLKAQGVLEAIRVSHESGTWSDLT
jgi:predicted dehydrogenase